MKLELLSVVTATLFAVAIAAAVVASNVLGHTDLLLSAINALNVGDSIMIDEVVIPVGLIVIGAFVDAMRLHMRDAERLRVLRTTMQALQDTVDDFLNKADLVLSFCE